MAKLYSYKGPIMVNDNCINNSYELKTSAFNKRDAYNRMIMRIRNFLLDDIDMNAKVTLPGRLSEVKL